MTAFAIGLALAFGLTNAVAPAALDMSAAAAHVVKGEAVSGCNAKAKQALSAVLQNAVEIGAAGSGEWKGAAAPDSTGNSFAAAAVHCFPLSESSYLVTFTCAAQTPPYPDTASALCEKISSAFGGGR